jgi:hypothetical protein
MSLQRIGGERVIPSREGNKGGNNFSCFVSRRGLKSAAIRAAIANGSFGNKADQLPTRSTPDETVAMLTNEMCSAPP